MVLCGAVLSLDAMFVNGQNNIQSCTIILDAPEEGLAQVPLSFMIHGQF